MWEARDRLQEISVCKYIWHRKQCFAFSNVWVITEVCTWVCTCDTGQHFRNCWCSLQTRAFQNSFQLQHGLFFPSSHYCRWISHSYCLILAAIFFVPLECCAPFWCQYLSNTFLNPPFQEGNNGRSKSFLGGTHTGNHGGFLRYWRLLI